jgi:hypothetical protein
VSAGRNVQSRSLHPNVRRTVRSSRSRLVITSAAACHRTPARVRDDAVGRRGRVRGSEPGDPGR